LQWFLPVVTTTAAEDDDDGDDATAWTRLDPGSWNGLMEEEDGGT